MKQYICRNEYSKVTHRPFCIASRGPFCRSVFSSTGKVGGRVRISRVWQLARRVTHESVTLAFCVFALWSTVAPADEGGPYVLRGPLAHVEPSQWYDATQDSAPDRDDALAGTRSTVGEHTDPSPARRARSCTWVVTTGDSCARDQLPFLTPYRGRAPPWVLCS